MAYSEAYHSRVMHNMARRRQTISYLVGDPPDLRDLLDQLRECTESPYWNRSLSDIGGMILLRAAQEEIAKYTTQEVDIPLQKKGSNAKA